MSSNRRQAAGTLLPHSEFVAIRDHVLKYCGVSLSEDHNSRLYRVVEARLRATGTSSVEEYIGKIANDSGVDGELARLVDGITNTETYFFREEFQLLALAGEILPELARSRSDRRRLSVWSAGCASGEEPLTVGMVVQSSELWPEPLSRWEIRILGTDINRVMIRKAREGIYALSAFKGLDPERRADIQSRFFDHVEDRFAVGESLRSMVSYLQLNLLDRDGSALFGEMDLILCRNVLMYFPTKIRLVAVQSFYRKLAPRGYLLLGHSENLLGMDTPFEPIRLQHSLVYRKPRRGRVDGFGAEWGS